MKTRGVLTHFTSPGFLQYDAARGVLRSPGGTRMLALNEDFLRGFIEACEYEAGPATPELLRRCGEFFGRRLAAWFGRESTLSGGAGAIHERSMIEFSVLLVDMWRGLGFGVLSVDWTRGERGVVAIRLEDSPMSRISLREHVGEDMFEGIFEGFFGGLGDGDLVCMQTGDARVGDAGGTSFIVGPRALIERGRTLREQGAPHDELLAVLAA